MTETPEGWTVPGKMPLVLLKVVERVTCVALFYVCCLWVIKWLLLPHHPVAFHVNGSYISGTLLNVDERDPRAVLLINEWVYISTPPLLRYSFMHAVHRKSLVLVRPQCGTTSVLSFQECKVHQQAPNRLDGLYFSSRLAEGWTRIQEKGSGIQLEERNSKVQDKPQEVDGWRGSMAVWNHFSEKRKKKVQRHNFRKGERTTYISVLTAIILIYDNNCIYDYHYMSEGFEV